MPKYLKGDTVAVTAKVLSASSDDDLEPTLIVMIEEEQLLVNESSVLPKSHKQYPLAPGDIVIRRHAPESRYKVLYMAWGPAVCREIGTDTIILLDQNDLKIVQQNEDDR